jgi:predicted esterase
MRKKLSPFEEKVKKDFTENFGEEENPRQFAEIADARTLIMILHGFKATPFSMRRVWYRARETFDDANSGKVDFFLPKLKLGLFSFKDPIEIVNELIDKIDKHLEKRGRPYDRIIIIGHSVGAVLARKLYILACGEPNGRALDDKRYKQLKAPFEEHAKASRPWAAHVERLILLAGMNRGWSISQHMDPFVAVKYMGGILLGKYVCKPVVYVWRALKRIVWPDMPRRPVMPVIFAMRRGASFLINLRIQWLAMRQAAKSQIGATANSVGSAFTVQLLGTIDDIVSPDDNVDLVSGADFIYLDVFKTGHVEILELDDTREGKDRTECFEHSLTWSKEALQKSRFRITWTNAPVQRTDVQHVAFIIHGIRDLGFWTTRIARRMKVIHQNEPLESVTPSYGYFPMLSFLLLPRRQEKVAWLMDQYSEALATYPRANFYFFGHSNGTYLLARALKDYPCCRFQRVAFAGSVVRTDFEWRRLLREGRIESMVNYVATRDWVVAWFPKVFEKLTWMDLGGAGFDGFKEMNQFDRPASLQPVQYVIGTHSAAMNEDNWSAIANFIIKGELKEPPLSMYTRERNKLDKLYGRLVFVIWPAIILSVVGLYWLVFQASQSLAKNGLEISMIDSKIPIEFLLAPIITCWIVYRIVSKV